MTDNPSGLPNSGAQKIVNFYIKYAGLGDDDRRSKCILILHYVMSIPIFATICQEFIGIFVKLKQGQFTLGEIVMQLEYGVLMCFFLNVVYSLTHKRSLLSKCIRNSTMRLQCYSQVDEALIWQKHLPVFNFLILNFTSSALSMLVLTNILYPSIRFILQREKISFLVFPNWYPMDVFSSNAWFWAAFVYEFLLHWYIVHIALSMAVIFLYVEVATNVGFDALCPYFEEILLCNRRISRESRQFKTGFFSKKDNQTRAIFEDAATTGVEINDDLNREKLIRGIEDWNTQRRQVKLINDTFAEYMSACHFTCSLTNVLMAFATTIELQHFHDETLKVVTGCSIYLSFVFTCGIFMYIVSYYVTLLQESHERLRKSLWNSSWAAKNTSMNKLFIHYNVALHQTMVLKVYSFYPLNLKSFSKDLSRLRTYFLFLYQLLAKHNT